jgi:hypothetical protein
VAVREQLLQPPLDCSTNPRRQTALVERNRYHRRPLLAQQNVVPRHAKTCHHNIALSGVFLGVLSRQARQARGGRTTRREHRGFSCNTPSWLYTHRGAIGKALRTAQVDPTTPPSMRLRTGPPRYRLHIASAHAPWSSSIVDTFLYLLGTDTLGVTAISLLSNSLAPSTYASYDSAWSHFVAFCTKENLPPLKATPSTMVRYTAWLGLLSIVAANSMQPHFSAVNKYFRDHQLPPIAVGDLLADARRGLEMVQHRLVPADTRLPLPAPVALDILTAANTLRDRLTWSPAHLPLLECFRACLAVCVNYTFSAAQIPAALWATSTSTDPLSKFVYSSASPKGTNAATHVTNWS